MTLQADVTKADDIERIVRQTADAYGTVNILVNNAGGPPAGTFDSLGDAAWQSAFELTMLSAVRMILVGTWARPDAKRRMLIGKWKAMVGQGLPREVIAWERLLWTLSDETLEQRDLIDQMISFFTRDEPAFTADIFARQCEACLGHDAADRLRGIQHPTLVVCGRHDALTPPKFSRELADEIPDARLVTLHHGGHVVMVEAVERFNHAVLQFLGDGR